MADPENVSAAQRISSDAEQLRDMATHHGHVPVMLERIVELLAPGIAQAEESGARAIVVDGTLGAGGHTLALLRTFPRLAVIGVDRDAESLAAATSRLAEFHDRFAPVHARFDEVGEVIAQASSGLLHEAQEGVAGALFDLGVSSMQLDHLERGFAYRADAALDMRMDTTQDLTAADVVNTYSRGELMRILRDYGEERFAGKIAAALVKERERSPFTHSARLVELLYQVIPAASRRTGGHPAKRTFQALRVEVNRELEAVERVLPVITDALRVGGRAVFMSYQSLEDRLVKRFFADLVRSKTPPGLPVDLPGTQPHFALVTRGAERATAEEEARNPRASSVRVRAIERIREQSSDPMFGGIQ